MTSVSPPREPTFKVALIQLYPKVLDPEHNFNTAAAHIRDAASKGASLAVLPEYHLSGWKPEDPAFAKIALTAYDYVLRYQEIAKECKINIVAGTIVTIDPKKHASQANGTVQPVTNGEKPDLLNISPFISYTGEILGTYTKTNLWIPERETLTSAAQVHRQAHSSMAACPPPQPHPIIETPLGPVGILVCWDLAFPEGFRALIRAGARIIIIPTFWTAMDMTPEGLAYNQHAEELFLKSALVCRAFENTCAIIFCNAGGPKEENYIGLSQVTMPIIGAVPGSFENGEPGMKIVDVNMNLVDVAEDNYKVREDIAREDWHYGYSHDT